MHLTGTTYYDLVFGLHICFSALTIAYSYSIPSANILWLTQHADVVDLDGDVATEAGDVDLAVELARTRRRSGACQPLFFRLAQIRLKQ